MRAGQLRHRITIQQRPSLPAPNGQPGLTWLDVATIRADIRFLNGLETVRSGGDVSIARASIRIRWRTDITADMRAVEQPSGRVYAIKAVLPDMQHRQYVDLTAEVVA